MRPQIQRRMAWRGRPLRKQTRGYTHDSDEQSQKVAHVENIESQICGADRSTERRRVGFCSKSLPLGSIPKIHSAQATLVSVHTIKDWSYLLAAAWAW